MKFDDSIEPVLGVPAIVDLFTLFNELVEKARHPLDDCPAAKMLAHVMKSWQFYDRIAKKYTERERRAFVKTMIESHKEVRDSIHRTKKFPDTVPIF